ncbi:unnamed protein product [Parnassius apollo]|uniref:(apollo) hypothetical protein n=1 Tax=Parnassius apollo TaxID=110799 RepID=A0A8S3XC73_PARAO|nr:unnamed protein product [Parnassius apollo]
MRELEQMRSTLDEAILETRSTPLENRPRTSPHSPKQAELGYREGSEPNAGDLFGSHLCETDSILFGAALAVCRIRGAKLSTAGCNARQSSAIPVWRTRIEEPIAKVRTLIGRLIYFRSGNTRPRIVRTVRMAFAGWDKLTFVPAGYNAKTYGVHRRPEAENRCLGKADSAIYREVDTVQPESSLSE